MIAHPARCPTVVAFVALAALSLGASPARTPVKPAETPEPVEPAKVLTVKAAAVTLPPGGTAEAVVTVALLPDYEIIASPPPTQWTTGATLTVVSAGGIVAKTPVFPDSHKTHDQDGGMEIRVWKGPFEVRVPIEASAKAAPGERTLQARLRYQARFAGEYYKVATRAFEIPVTIVKAKKGTAGAGGAAAPATRP